MRQLWQALLAATALGVAVIILLEFARTHGWR